MELILALVGFVCVIALVVAGVFAKGADSGQQEHDRKVLKDVEEAKKARHRMRHDREYADRVRDEFTR